MPQILRTIIVKSLDMYTVYHLPVISTVAGLSKQTEKKQSDSQLFCNISKSFVMNFAFFAWNAFNLPRVLFRGEKKQKKYVQINQNFKLALEDPFLGPMSLVIPFRKPLTQYSRMAKRKLARSGQKYYLLAILWKMFSLL